MSTNLPIMCENIEQTFQTSFTLAHCIVVESLKELGYFLAWHFSLLTHLGIFIYRKKSKEYLLKFVRVEATRSLRTLFCDKAKFDLQDINAFTLYHIWRIYEFYYLKLKFVHHKKKKLSAIKPTPSCWGSSAETCSRQFFYGALSYPMNW